MEQDSMNCTPSASCYQRCGRPECRKRRLRYLKERRVHGPKRVPVGPSAEKIRELRKTYSLDYIGHVIGINSGHVANIANEKNPTIHRDLARRIEQFQPDPLSTHWVDATGTQRRLQALILRGWPTHVLSRRLGCSAHWVFSVSQGKTKRVAQFRATAVADLFRQLWNQPAPEGRSAKLAQAAARRHGFISGLAWDDIDNDPAPVGLHTSRRQRQDVDPVKVQRAIDGDQTVRLNPQERNQAVAALVTRGLTDRRIAAVLGCTPETVQRSRTRQGIAPAVPATWTKGAA